MDIEDLPNQCHPSFIFIAIVVVFALQLVYERIPRGDLQQRLVHVRVLADGAFWDNTLLGEAFIPLGTLVPGQRWVDWHPLAPARADAPH